MSSDGIHTTTKKELVGRIAEQTGQTKVVVKEILQSFLDEIVRELAQGNRLEFREFGVFGAAMEVELVNDGPVTFVLEEGPGPGSGPPSQALA